MNAFRRFGWERQLAAADRQKQDLGEAVVVAGPLALIHERKEDDVPYFRAGFVWRRIQQHLGKTHKASELQWKRQWTSTYKAKYYPVRSNVQRWHELLAGDTAVWLSEADDVLQRRIAELKAKLDDGSPCLGK